MSRESEGEPCPICFECKEDMRVLPCWHIACMGCILSMAQSGQGRTITCHVCRAPCLFENIRSLPHPIRCKLCSQFVKNPRKFPCCSSLHCFECVSNRTGSDGEFGCPNHSVTITMCCLCFGLHGEDARGCGHSTCPPCYSQLQTEGSYGSPGAVNPAAPTLDHVAPLRRLLANNPPADLDQGMGNQIQLLNAVYALGGVRNVLRAQADIQAPPYRIPETAVDDFKKACVFAVCFLGSSCLDGMSWRMWILPCASLFVTRPSPVGVRGLWVIMFICLAVFSCFYSFFEFLAYLVFDQALRCTWDYFFFLIPSLVKAKYEWPLWYSTGAGIVISTYFVFSEIYVHVTFACVILEQVLIRS